MPQVEIQMQFNLKNNITLMIIQVNMYHGC
jgi:hypothetical protein